MHQTRLSEIPLLREEVVWQCKPVSPVLGVVDGPAHGPLVRAAGLVKELRRVKRGGGVWPRSRQVTAPWRSFVDEFIERALSLLFGECAHAQERIAARIPSG